MSESIQDRIMPTEDVLNAYQDAQWEGLFVDGWEHFTKEVHETAKSKGWWDKPRSDGEVLVLVHAEISEAVEALRNGNPPDHHCPEFTGLEVELADAIIRIMDYGAFRGLRIGEAIMAKIEYNKGRPVRHGGKEF